MIETRFSHETKYVSFLDSLYLGFYSDKISTDVVRKLKFMGGPVKNRPLKCTNCTTMYTAISFALAEKQVLQKYCWHQRWSYKIILPKRSSHLTSFFLGRLLTNWRWIAFTPITKLCLFLWCVDVVWLQIAPELDQNNTLISCQQVVATLSSCQPNTKLAFSTSRVLICMELAIKPRFSLAKLTYTCTPI